MADNARGSKIDAETRRGSTAGKRRTPAVLPIRPTSTTQPGALQLLLRSNDLLLVLLGLCALVLTIVGREQYPFISPLQLLTGLVYVLFVPGYCLQLALFAQADTLDAVERLGLSLGLSITWVPVLALILDWLPWGLQLWPIVWAQVGSILLFTAMAIWRRARLLEDAYVPSLPCGAGRWWRHLTWLERCLYCLLATAVLLGTTAMVWLLDSPSSDEFHTEFYILGSDGLAATYPGEVTEGTRLKLQVGIVNREREREEYRIEVWATDLPVEDRRSLVAEVSSIALEAGEQWEQPISWRMPRSGDDQVVELWLFRDERPADKSSIRPTEVSAAIQPYRRLRLWINVPPDEGERTREN